MLCWIDPRFTTLPLTVLDQTEVLDAMYDLVDKVEERIDPFDLGPPYIDIQSDRDNTISVFYGFTWDEDDVGGVRALVSIVDRIGEKEREWVRQTILDTRQYHDPANVFHFTHDEQELALVMNDVLGAMTKRALESR